MIKNLLAKLKHNNGKAQQDFYYKYAESMFLLVYRYVNNEQDAGSIVNSGFFKIFQKISDFRYINEQALIAWMKKIMINEALFFLRKKINYEDIYDTHNSISPTFNTAENNLAVEEYYKIISSLPGDLRTVFNLYAIDGYSHKEISEKTGIKESSSRVYLTRARKILQEKLKNYEK